MSEKVVLAYSGGLDTTAIIPWLKETFGYEVICCCIDCGQGNELDGLDERAKLSGASKLYIEDVTDEFCDDFIMPCVEAGAVYEHKYLLGTSMARPVIAKKLVEIARKEGAVAICHGATGKGNDQIRFELGIKALAPDIKVIAPWRMPELWKMDSREAEMAYCKAHGIDLPFAADSSYSRDRNLWHISHEGLELEDPSQEPNYDHMLVLSVTPQKAPDKETEISMTFEKGVPKTLNGKAMKVSDIIRELNRLGGENGIGIIDIVENRVVGMKSRGVYETPGGTILMAAHEQLEELTLDRETMETKKKTRQPAGSGSLRRKMVYSSPGSHPGICGIHPEICHRRSKDEAVQGQHYQGGNHLPLQPVQRVPGLLQDRRHVRSPGRFRLHHPLRTASEGSGYETPGSREESEVKSAAKKEMLLRNPGFIKAGVLRWFISFFSFGRALLTEFLNNAGYLLPPPWSWD